MSQVTSHKSKRLIRGFTLIEMMVVIGIIAILGAVAIPGFKTLYRTYKTFEVYDQADTLIRTLTASYLIMNEDNSSTPAYANKQVILGRFTPFLPGNSFDPTKYVAKSRLLIWNFPDETKGWQWIGRGNFSIVKKSVSGNYVTPYWWDGFVEQCTKRGCTCSEKDTTLEIELPYLCSRYQ